MRRSILLATTAGLALSLAACGGGGGGAEETTSAPEATTGGATGSAGTLTIWVDDTRINDFTSLAADFEATSGIALNVVQKPSADIQPDFIRDVPTGKGPDLVVGAHDWVGNLASNGTISPVEIGDKADGFAKLALQGFTYEGQLYGVPYSTENIALVRNNALATETPATLDELIAAKPAEAEFPILVQMGAGGDPYHMYPIQSSFGAPVFVTDSSGQYTPEIGMGGDAGAAFATYLQTLGAAGVLSTNIDSAIAKQAFLDGKSPYMITGPWNIGDFQAKGLDVSVLPVPSAGGQPSAPFVGVQGVYLSSKSTNTLLANQFFDYLATPATQTMLYELGGRYPAMTESAAAVEDPILNGFAEAGSQGQPMPAIPEMAKVWTFWGETEASIVSGKATDPVASWNTMIDNIKAAF